MQKYQDLLQHYTNYSVGGEIFTHKKEKLN